MQQKIYLVLERLHVLPPDGANRRVVAAKLTRAAAQAIVDGWPGTYVERHDADKEPRLSCVLR